MKLEDAIAYLRPIADSAHIKNYRDAIHTVVDAARKQIPQEPADSYQVGEKWYYLCECGGEIKFARAEYGTNELFCYCPCCGQRMKWPKRQNE